MIRLFKYEGYQVTVEPEALLLIPFKTLYDRDKNKDKSMAKQELAYIYFMGDPRSDYQYLLDEDTRSEEIIKGLGMPAKWKPDNTVKRALAFYKSFKPISASILEGTRIAADKFRKFLMEMDPDERDEKGKPIYNPSAIAKTIKEIPALVEDLDKAEKALTKDLMQEAKARGSQTKALEEDED